MNQSVAKIWVDALRSGRYIQGLGALKRIYENDGCAKYCHCCLGVLCELFDENNEEKLTKTNMIKIAFNGETEILPSEVMEWAGLSTTKGSFILHGTRQSLVEINDKGCPFRHIADTIEQNVENL